MNHVLSTAEVVDYFATPLDSVSLCGVKRTESV